MYRFLLTRRWIVLQLLLVVFVFVFVEAGFWQLRRLDEKRRVAHQLIQHGAIAEAPLDEVLTPGARPHDIVYRRVRITGRYDVAQEVVLASRVFDGISGHNLLTPLVDASGRAIIVNRGWVPLDDGQPGVAVARPPDGLVTLHGILLETQRRGRFGPRIPATGTLTELFRVDVPRLAKQLPYPTAPLYVLLRTQEPAQSGELPKPVDPPKPDEGPHLSYAIQWFAFTLTAIATYLALVWRTSRATKAGAGEENEPTLEGAAHT